MNLEIEKIEKNLLSQPSVELFSSRKLYYLNTNKIDKHSANLIEIKYLKRNEEIEKTKCNKSLLELLNSFEFNEAEKLYNDKSKYISEEFYFGEKLKAQQNYELYILSNKISDVRKNNEENLSFICTRGVLSSSKLNQYKDKMVESKKKGKWEECYTWMYIASEYVFELWLKRKGIKYLDYNIKNPFHKRDYCVNNIDIDVKTTIGVGRRYLPKYNNVKDIEEIIIGVGSRIKKRDDDTSKHCIHGIYDKSIYEDINIRLKYYTHDKSYLNPCYFSSLDDYFRTEEKITTIMNFNKLKAENNFIKDSKYIDALFLSMNNKEIIDVLKKILPKCHLDLISIIDELLKKNKIFLLPHFLADYVLGKIINKKQIEQKAITKIIYSIFKPYKYQEIYLDNLFKAKEAMNNVRCVNHNNETIDEMEIEYYMGSKPTLKACCSYDQRIKTTFYTYSWKTGETLASGIRLSNKQSDIPIPCDADNCGCLTHIHDGDRIGKRSCKKYGESRF